MRIALVSTLRTAAPPPRTGSVELIVALLARWLTEFGHDVTVFATGDSNVPGRLVSLFERGYHYDPGIWDWELAEFMQLGGVYERAREFDVIHSHVYCYALPFSRLVQTPTIHTFHICPTPDFARYCGMYPDSNYTLLTEYQREFFQNVPVRAVINNGIDTAAFRWSAAPGGYIAFLGVFRPDKGPLDAIRAALRAGIPIKLAGPNSGYFQDAIAPLVDGKNVEYVGEVNHDEKVKLLSGAIATVFPVRAQEACPLVILESLACGVPVVGFRSGPLPELIMDGVTGILADDDDGLSAALMDAARLDRSGIRAQAVERFDARRMAGEYLLLYRTIASKAAVPRQ